MQQMSPGTLRSQALQKTFRRDAGPALEKPVKMKGAQSGLLSQDIQSGLLPDVLRQVMDDPGNPVVIIHGASIIDSHAGAHPILAVIVVQTGNAPANQSKCFFNCLKLQAQDLQGHLVERLAGSAQMDCRLNMLD